MPRIPQAPPPGVFRNATPEATPGHWYDSNMVRFRGGQLQPIGGNVALTNAVFPDLPRDMLTWHDARACAGPSPGRTVKLFAYRFEYPGPARHHTNRGWPTRPARHVHHRLRPAGDYGEEAYGTARTSSDVGPSDIAATMGDRWSMDTFGEDLLVVPTQDGQLYRWTPLTPTVLPAIVAGAPTQNRGVIVTDQRHVVLLAAGGDPRKIAWSDQEDPNTWLADVTNLAGDKMLVTQSLRDDGGEGRRWHP